jgi:hypothetical protein
VAASGPLDLTGATTTLVLRDKYGLEVDTSGGIITVLDARLGKLRHSPPATLFAAALSPYVGRWRVVDAAATISFWPTRDGDQWFVG